MGTEDDITDILCSLYKMQNRAATDAAEVIVKQREKIRTLLLLLCDARAIITESVSLTKNVSEQLSPFANIDMVAAARVMDKIVQVCKDIDEELSNVQ